MRAIQVLLNLVLGRAKQLRKLRSIDYEQIL